MIRRTLLFTVALVPLAAACATTEEGESGGPCLPLHTIEGMSGHFSVPSAYFANLPPKGEVLGLPSVGATYVHLGHGKNLEAYSITETLWDRIELGYAFDMFDVGDAYEDIRKTFGIEPDGDYVQPDEYESVPDVLESEDDWWVLAAAYLPTDSLSLALGYGHFGRLLNHEANSSWGIAAKFEF